MNDRPIIPYWHLWTDADGISRQTQCALNEFELKSMKPPADPQWLERFPLDMGHYAYPACRK